MIIFYNTDNCRFMYEPTNTVIVCVLTAVFSVCVLECAFGVIVYRRPAFMRLGVCVPWLCVYVCV